MLLPTLLLPFCCYNFIRKNPLLQGTSLDLTLSPLLRPHFPWEQIQPLSRVPVFEEWSIYEFLFFLKRMDHSEGPNQDVIGYFYKL